MKKQLAVALCLVAWAAQARGADGVSPTTLTVGSVLALKGPASGLGSGMKAGMEAAFKGEQVHGRSILLVVGNDFYEPEKAVEETRKLMQQGIFAMIGNVGTPTAAATLPILKEAGIPAIGFFTGAGILRPGGGGPIVNYRASYVQETVTVIKQALETGVAINQVCAFVQNDGFGMAGLAGVKLAFEQNHGNPEVITALDGMLKMTGDNPDRNNKGPVGVYTRNDIEVRPGYASLKAWEKRAGTKCRVVVTVGAYTPIGHFARVSRRAREKYVISAVSFTGADNLLADLRKYKATDRFVMTQVVPLLDSKLPIVLEAKQRLGKDFGFVSLEGYIVGKLFMHVVGDLPGEPTRDAFMKQVAASKFDLGGIPIDFGKGNQGSNLIETSYVAKTGFLRVTPEVWKQMLK